MERQEKNNKGDIPVGLGMSLAMDPQAMAHFGGLSEMQRQKIIGYIQASRTGEQAEQRIKQIVADLHTGEG